MQYPKIILGEASLHQRLGEQDSWLKPKLLGWKLERNRQSPLSSSNTFELGFKDYSSFENICSLILRIAILFAALVACIAVSNVESPLKNSKYISDNPTW